METPDESRRPSAPGAPAESLRQAGGRPGRPDPLRSLRRPGFLLFLVGSLASGAGNQMRTVAVGWEVYQRTGTPLSLGLVGLTLALPVLLLALPAGAAADRYPRKTLILISQVGLALSGLGLAWVAWTDGPIALTYAFLLGTGVARAVGWPASQAIVTGLVPAPLFANAAMWRSVAFQLSATLGPLAGGALLALHGADLVYVVDAASSLVLFGCLLFVRPTPQARSAETTSWASLVEGARFVRRQPVILSTITLDMVAVLFGGAVALLPVYATDVLGVGAVGFGWMRAMPSLGAIAMGLALAVLPPMQRAGRALLWTVAAFGVATIVFGLSTSYPLSLTALFCLGAADNVSVVIRSTALQLLTPDAIARARGGRQRRVHRDEQRDRRARVGRGRERHRVRGDGRGRRRPDAGDRRGGGGCLARAPASRVAGEPGAGRARPGVTARGGGTASGVWRPARLGGVSSATAAF